MEQENRKQIIETTKTPMGFFVLLILITELFFGIGFYTAPSSYKPFFLAIFTIVLFGTLILVAFFAVKFPEALKGERYEAEKESDALFNKTEEYFQKRINELELIRKEFDENSLIRQNSILISLTLASGLFGLYFFCERFIVHPYINNNNIGNNIVYSFYHSVYYPFCILIAIVSVISRRKVSTIVENILYSVIISFSITWLFGIQNPINIFSLHFFSIFSSSLFIAAIIVFIIRYDYKDIFYNPRLRNRGGFLILMFAIIPLISIMLQSKKYGTFKELDLFVPFRKEIPQDSLKNIYRSDNVQISDFIDERNFYSSDTLYDLELSKQLRSGSVSYTIWANIKEMQIFSPNIVFESGLKEKIDGQFRIYPSSKFVINKDTLVFENFCDVDINEFGYIPPIGNSLTTYCSKASSVNRNLYLLENFIPEKTKILFKVEFVSSDSSDQLEEYELYINTVTRNR